MNHLDYIFQIWDVLYKDQDTKAVIEKYYHHDYNQYINGNIMNRDEYIDHVIEQKKNLKSIEFKYQNHLAQSDELFIIYYVKGQNIKGDDIAAEVIAYFKFKDSKIFKIQGHVHLSKGLPSDIDMKN